MPKLKLNPSIEIALKKNMIDGKTKQIYFEERRFYKSSLYQAATTSERWRITGLASNCLPRHIFIVFQLADKDNSQTENNRVFDSVNISEMYANINTKQYPEVAYQKLDNKNFIRPYLSLVNDSINEESLEVSLEEFSTLYPIFHIDTSKFNINDSAMSIADIELNFRLSEAASGNYYVYALISSDRWLEMNTLDGKLTNIK